MAEEWNEVYLRVDMTALMRLKEQYQKEAPKLWEYAARRHLQYLQKRFLAMSVAFGQEGDTTWPRLKPSTLKSKAYKRKIFKLGGSFSLTHALRLSDTLRQSFSYIIRKDGYFIGILKDKQYRQVGKTLEEGNRMVYCSLTVAQLADVHQKGIGVPRRSVMPSATNRGQLRMLQLHVNDRFNKLIVHPLNRKLKAQ